MDNFISVIWYHLKRYGTKEFIISLHLENVNIKKNWYEYIESGPDQNLVDIIYIYIYIIDTLRKIIHHSWSFSLKSNINTDIIIDSKWFYINIF